jgi:putative ABC transport system permease protein
MWIASMADRVRGESFSLALIFARRELRGGLKGFRIFLACLVLGVAAIAAVGSLSSSIVEGLQQNGRAILGGDIDLRLTHRPATKLEYDWLATQAKIGEIQTTRAMARAPASGKRLLSELKAVDDLYPFVGILKFSSGQPLAETLALKGGKFGVLVEATLLDRLKVKNGSILTFGNQEFEIRGVLEDEPDKAAHGIGLGPRSLISTAGFEATGLIQPGSMIWYHYRLKLNQDQTVESFKEDMKETFPDYSWRVRDASNGAPGLKRFVDRVALFLTLVGLTALIVGGVGVGNAVKSYLEGKIKTIATLKCLGATGSFIFRVHFLQVLILAFAGTILGLAVGAFAAMGMTELLSGALPVPPEKGFYAAPLLLATAYGLLIAILFALWPLASARETAAAALFRDLVSQRRFPRPFYLVAIAISMIVLAGLAVFSSTEPYFAVFFVVGAATIFAVLCFVGWLVMALAKRLPRVRIPTVRLAISNLYRPGAATLSVILSLGLGLTLFVTVALIEGNLTRQVQEQLPENAPAFFFIDIQQNQIDEFVTIGESIDGVSDVSYVPNMRGRIVKLAGVPAEEVTVAPEAKWMMRGDRGMTYAAIAPDNAMVVEGKWWPADYTGEPLVSIVRQEGKGMGLEIGSTITINVMGRDITAKVANFREVDWSTLGINFALMFDPNSLKGAPHSYLATAKASPEAETELFRAVTDRFTNISVIRMKEALNTIADILQKLSVAVSATSSITLVAGLLVLAGAFAAGHRKRVYDAVIMKVLGATRADIFKAYSLEYALLGVVTAMIAAGAGSLAAWLVITEVLEARWINLPGTLFGTVIISVLVALIFGLVGSWRALGEKAAPVLRID